MTAAGVPASMLNIGMPFYGWVSTGGGVTGPRQPWGGQPWGGVSGQPSMWQMTYHNIASSYNLSNSIWDAGAQTPYLLTGSGWITYDDERSVAAKVAYARNNSLGGWIIWALDQDYMPNQTPRHPLLTAVRNALAGLAAPVAAPPPAAFPVPIPAPPIALALPQITAVLPAMISVGVPFSATLTSAGSSGVVWSVSGLFPPGFSLDPNSGVISGTPATVGMYSFRVEAGNGAGADSKNFTLLVLPPGL